MTEEEQNIINQTTTHADVIIELTKKLAVLSLSPIELKPKKKRRNLKKERAESVRQWFMNHT